MTTVAASMRADLLSGFVLGCLLTVGGTWLLTDLNAQSPDLDTVTVHVCIDDERVMRLTGQMDACPPGQKSMFLRRAPDKEAKQEEARTASKADEQRLAELERRLQKLDECEARGEMGSKVVAPFEVVDRTGKPIMSVQEGRTAFYNSSGKPVAHITYVQSGGFFEGLSGTTPVSAGIGSLDDNVGVMINENSNQVRRIQLGRSEAGTYHLKFFARDGKSAIAGIGQSLAGPGLAFVGDEAGNVKVRVMVSEANEAGQVQVANRADTTVAVFGEEQTSGGGYFVLYGANGTPMVDAGVTKDGVGVVRAGPSGYTTGVSMVGLPGSFLIGKKQ